MVGRFGVVGRLGAVGRLGDDGRSDDVDSDDDAEKLSVEVVQGEQYICLPGGEKSIFLLTCFPISLSSSFMQSNLISLFSQS